MKTNRIVVLALLALALLALAAPVGAIFVPATGACCLPDGKCEMKSEGDCHDAGGDFRGVGSFCPASGYCVTVGGTTEPLGVSGVIASVVALAVVVAAGAAATVLIKRRTA